jgi:hypothetical protein
MNCVTKASTAACAEAIETPRRSRARPGTFRDVGVKSGAPGNRMSIRSARFVPDPRYARKPRGMMPTTTTWMLFTSMCRPTSQDRRAIAAARAHSRR